MKKCAWYLVEWKFNKNETSIIIHQKEVIYFIDADGRLIQSQQIQLHHVTAYLGVTSKINGQQDKQRVVINNKANKNQSKTQHMSPSTLLCTDTSTIYNTSKVNLSTCSIIVK